MQTNTYNYGVIGNGKSAALVDTRGAIVWCCLPDFDSSSVFAALLDEKQGGHFSIAVSDSYRVTQRYEKQTNILVTRFDSGPDAFEVQDFMPRYRVSGLTRDYYAPPDVVRLFRWIRGRPELRVLYDPRLDYARGTTMSGLHASYIKSHTVGTNYESMYLYSNFDAKALLSGEPIVLKEDGYCLISYNEKLVPLTMEDVELQYQKTKAYWMNWASHTRRYPLYGDLIVRNALTLKMMHCQGTGAVVAAVTTSLPETLGEPRNWDYRFCWIRDASMTVSVLTELGHDYMARSFAEYIQRVVPWKNEKIQIMYGLRGQKILTEEILDHLCGYQGSRPVRIGNAAFTQKQNDIYGVVLDMIDKALPFFNHRLDFMENLWTTVRGLLRNVQAHWHEPDRSIWEIRGEEDHFTFSKVLCWVAADRVSHIATVLGQHDHARRAEQLALVIRQDILEKGWNPTVGAFTQKYGSPHLDAANLLICEYGFIRPDDPRYIATVEKTYSGLCCDGLMYRYRNDDDFGTPKSSFTICSFWMVKALIHIGRVREAQGMFEKIVSYANHVGLLSEDLDFKTKRQLGNFPQAYSHLALISCAIALNNALVDEGTAPAAPPALDH